MVPRGSPLASVQERLSEFRAHLIENNIEEDVPPLSIKDKDKPGRDWLPEPEWISGWTAFEMFQLQDEPGEWAPIIAKICKVITDQTDRDLAGPNFVMAKPPPSHPMLDDFQPGSRVWFRALYELLIVKGGEEIEGQEHLVSELYEWIGPWDNLRLKAVDVVNAALQLDWYVQQIALPEAKQTPIWTFPMALTWIATRDFLAMARMPVFCRPAKHNDDAVALDGVWLHATKALGWLHTELSYVHCKCGARRDYGYECFKHCTCISIAWEELVRHMGGLADNIPEFVFNLHEGWVSMTWPDGADEIRFLRSEIMETWPAVDTAPRVLPNKHPSIASIEKECEKWLAEQFADDPEKRLTKGDFRNAALNKFSNGLTERGFNQRVWPKLAREHGRDGAGAKRKS